MAEKLFHIGVKGLIKNREGKFLVFMADNTNFTMPGPAHGDLVGGRIEVGQAPEMTLVREIEEETGVRDVSNIRFLTAVISQIQIKLDDGTVVGLALMVYQATIPDDATIILSDEHTKYEWLDRHAAADALAYKFGEEFSDWLQGGAADALLS